MREISLSRGSLDLLHHLAKNVAIAPDGDGL